MQMHCSAQNVSTEKTLFQAIRERLELIHPWTFPAMNIKELIPTLAELWHMYYPRTHPHNSLSES